MKNVFLLLVSVCVASCGSESDSEAPATNFIPKEHYDSLSPNPMPLQHSKGSIEDLLRSAVTALNAHDTAALADLAISPEEYSAIIFPELGIHWGSARDRRPQIVSFLKDNHFASSEKALPRLLRDFGGRDVEFAGVVPFDSVQQYVSYRIHLDTRVAVRTDAGHPDTVRAFGSVVEKDGGFKFLSFRDDY